MRLAAVLVLAVVAAPVMAESARERAFANLAKYFQQEGVTATESSDMAEAWIDCLNDADMAEIAALGDPMDVRIMLAFQSVETMMCTTERRRL